METSNRSAFLKLRSACDQCHFSKVRCTGEKSGCRRCRNGRRTCHYSASNMGKAVGSRQHKRDNGRSGNLTAPNAEYGAARQLVPDSPSFTDTQNLDFWPQFDANTSEDADLAAFISDLNDTENPNDTNLMCMDGAPNTEFSEIDFLATPESQSGVLSQTPSHSQSSRHSSTSFMSKESPVSSSSTSNYGSTTELTTRIHELSQKLSQSPLALDEILSANAFYLQIIESNIINIPTDPSRMSIILMMIICLTQVLTLFEECIKPGAEKTIFDMENGPILLLGSFQVDLESQRQIRIKIVQKELKRIFSVAGGLTRVLQQHPIAVGLQDHTYRTLLADIQKRVQFLVQIVKNG
ncbi:hypothetical protein DM02DRAFT_671864 [Periconia macrospinosa]|uniref:Zn(2)-C6 fungal-type domain-containing protein n=1 Tax=Periconia macrospinosa TaxID=97972 RepID=A0A2V1DTT7_9PLEO|nr:hypothetical protein DM02DRAFT_671864 [Periconia macrospinosa]